MERILINEGWHSYIYIYGDKIIKKFKDNLKKNFLKELFFLKKLKKFRFVPKIFDFDIKNLEIIEEYIDGIFFIDILKYGNKKIIKYYIKKLLILLFILDKLKIEKEEMTRPFKNIIIKNKKIYLLDWERSRIKSNPSNITQFLSFLINSKFVDFINNKNILFYLSKIYKRKYSFLIIRKIIKIIEES